MVILVGPQSLGGKDCRRLLKRNSIGWIFKLELLKIPSRSSGEREGVDTFIMM